MNDLQEGDVVRPAGWHTDMVVLSSDVGAEVEGIANGVLCAWTDENGEHEEVFRRAGMKVIMRDGKAVQKIWKL